VRLLIYTDSIYREADGVVYGELSFTIFQAALASRLAAVTIIGRLDPDPGAIRYPLPATVGFVGLPYYESLARPAAALLSLVRSLRAFWRALDEADGAWLFGPYLHALIFALLTRLRRRKLILGVRQDFPSYVRRRRPTMRWMHVTADALELAWRLLARRYPVVVVGPELLLRYGDASRALGIMVSLISEDDVNRGQQAARRYDGELTLISVGRLDEEKNPLLLADVLARLHRKDPRWRMVVCGDGPLQSTLADRLVALGVADTAELRGHVPFHDDLMTLYRTAHVFLHVSWTEGVPQVLLEAFASGTPVVATGVGGVPGAVGDAALLVPPGDADLAAETVARVAADPVLRERLVRAGFALARRHTLQAEIDRAVEVILDS
jgi:glycosyltransferase involved in cell wall biosynthesis